MSYLGSDRFVVREVEGWLTIGKRHYGLCCAVYDRAYCFECMAEFTTEQIPHVPEFARRMVVRRRAAERAEVLNARHA